LSTILRANLRQFWFGLTCSKLTKTLRKRYQRWISADTRSSITAFLGDYFVNKIRLRADATALGGIKRARQLVALNAQKQGELPRLRRM
jgi:hypothetical protein